MEKKTYEEIQQIIMNRYPDAKGFSVRSIKRFCEKEGISPRISQEYLEEIVLQAVEEVFFYFRNNFFCFFFVLLMVQTLS